VGYAVIAWFLRYIVKHSLDVFAIYRLVLASVVLVWLWGA
jgi:undecaprenyl-diphosphatase